MGFASAKEYEKAAAAVVSDSRALYKLEKEDGDDVYYLKDTNEFVIVSTDGYIRTYFYPRDGIEYFERQQKKKEVKHGQHIRKLFRNTKESDI